MHAEDRPLRIALLAYRGKPHVGGQGVYVRHLSKALVDLGHRVEVLGGQPYPQLDPRIPLVELPSLFSETGSRRNDGGNGDSTRSSRNGPGGSPCSARTASRAPVTSS